MQYAILTIMLLLSVLVKAQTDQSQYKEKEHHEWSYHGDYGPEHWIELDPEYSPCAGMQQSPIDINSKKSLETQLDIEFHYHPFFVDLINDGHTLIERIIEPKALTLGEVDYTLLQVHFHTPSEHHVDGLEYQRIGRLGGQARAIDNHTEIKSG